MWNPEHKASQLKIPFKDTKKTNGVFRPIHYLGSKLRILDSIKTIIDDVDSSGGRVYDLFAGTGSVARKLAYSRPVTTVDVQEYSRVLCSALLNPSLDKEVVKSLVQHSINSKYANKINWAIKPLVKYEIECVNNAISGQPEELCDLLENGSIISYQLNKDNYKGSLNLLTLIKESLDRIYSLGILSKSSTAIRYTGGLYFSYRQAAQIDILLHFISNCPDKYKDNLLAALLSTVSDAVNTIGKQFAQPLRPRRSDGKIKSSISKKVQKDRSINIINEYQNWVQKYIAIPGSDFSHKSYCMNYGKALDTISSDATVVYADPPYTRDHYSRYYHVLETICKRDNPDITRIKVNGKQKATRGVYRNSRHQSPFCIKSKADSAFEELISKSAKSDLDLVISYSPYDKNTNSRPRLLTTDQLYSLAKKYYNNVELISLGKFTHSKLTHSEKHLDTPEKGELLVVCGD